MSARKRSILCQILGGVLAASKEQEQPGDAGDGSGAAVAAPAKSMPKKKPGKPKQKPLPPWNVVLLGDDDHSYADVIEMLGRVFGYDTTRAYQMAREVDSSGRVIVYTTHRELAELKREQIIGFGTDPRIASCRGGMGAVIEPAR